MITLYKEFLTEQHIESTKVVRMTLLITILINTSIEVLKTFSRIQEMTANF